MIKVDGRNYKVHVLDVGLDVEFMYKYAERTEDFELKYELGAVYYNQSIVIGCEDSSNADFQDLFRLLSTKSKIDDGTGHNVEIWTPIGKLTFVMYPNKIQLKMKKARGQQTWWNDMQIKFIAVKPVESF